MTIAISRHKLDYLMYGECEQLKRDLLDLSLHPSPRRPVRSSHLDKSTPQLLVDSCSDTELLNSNLGVEDSRPNRGMKERAKRAKRAPGITDLLNDHLLFFF